MAGLSAAALGAAEVVLTDLPHLLPLAERNIQARSSGTLGPLNWGSLVHLPVNFPPAACGIAPPPSCNAPPASSPAGTVNGELCTGGGAASRQPMLAAICPTCGPLVLQLNSLQGVASAAKLCWGEPVGHLRPPFDLVLASDVIYQSEAVPALLATLRKLSGPSTLILLAAEHREKLPFPRQQVEAAGLQVQQVSCEELHPEWRSDDIQVYRLLLLPQP